MSEEKYCPELSSFAQERFKIIMSYLKESVRMHQSLEIIEWDDLKSVFVAKTR